MTVRIGLRREDKSHWERRAPLTPDHVAELRNDHGIVTVVESSSVRVFPDGEYASSGADISDDLTSCPVIFAVKEIPHDKLEADKTYVFFSHVIKGQPHNMPMLRRLMDLGCTLIDYELITNAHGFRLIFFGRHAGYAGMIDSLHALGLRLEWEGRPSPLREIRMAHSYDGLDAATQHIAKVGEQIRHHGFGGGLRPIVVAFTGEGNVSAGAQEVFDRLPVELVEPEDLERLPLDRDRPQRVLHKLLLPPQRTVDRIDGGEFDWDDYVDHPDAYCGCMERWLPHITMLINGIYWDPRFPRLVTREMLTKLWASEGQKPKLRVIGDISCDVGGSIEATVKCTTPGNPVYVFEVETGQALDGVEGNGPVVMAVDNLPCELPREASEHFGDSLLRFVSPMARCDWTRSLESLEVPREIRDAIIVHRGDLTPRYKHLEQHLSKH